MLYVLAISYIFIGCVFSKEIPSFVHVCRRHDPEFGKCLVKSMNELLPRLKHDVPELNLPSLEPLYFNDISMNTGGSSAVKIDIVLTNGTISGLTNIDIKSCNKIVEKAEFTCSMTFPFLRIRGHYEMKGRIMLFQVDSDGLVDLNATNVAIDGKWYGKVFKKDGKDRTKYEKFEGKADVEGMQVYFEDIFRGNDALSENTNKVLNENIRSLKDDLDPVIRKTISNISLEYLNRVYALFTLDQLYPKDE